MDKAFIKGLRVIEALAQSGGPRGITELATELQMTKSNVHRLVTTLQAQGYVRQLAALGTYEMTPRLWELGCRVMSRFDFTRFARYAMQRLAEQTKETVHLSILEGFEVLYLDKIESAHHVRAYTSVGSRAPAWCVATGKAMLAYMPADYIEPIESKLAPFTSTSITTMDELRRELATVRRLGYAIYKGEWRDSVYGVAAAVFNGSGEVVGAIGISGPAQRLPLSHMKKISVHVTEAAGAIAQSLGYRPELSRVDTPNVQAAWQVTA